MKINDFYVGDPINSKTEREIFKRFWPFLYFRKGKPLKEKSTYLDETESEFVIIKTPEIIHKKIERKRSVRKFLYGQKSTFNINTDISKQKYKQFLLSAYIRSKAYY